MRARNVKTSEIFEIEMVEEKPEEKKEAAASDAGGQAFCIIFIPGAAYELIPAEAVGTVTSLWGEAETIREMPETGMVMLFDSRCLRRIDGEAMVLGGSPVMIMKTDGEGKILGLHAADIFAVQEALKKRKAMIVNACGAAIPAFSVE